MRYQIGKAKDVVSLGYFNFNLSREPETFPFMLMSLNSFFLLFIIFHPLS